MYASINGFDGYLASSDGYIVRISGKQLIPLQGHCANRFGKQYVFLMKPDGLYAQRAVDKLIMEAFSPISDFKIIGHRNGDISDCRLANLMWVKYRRCEKCTDFGVLCNNFDSCKIVADQKEQKSKNKPPSQAKVNRSKRMADIADKASKIDIQLVKANLRDIVIELCSGELPGEIHERLTQKGYTFKLQYIYKIMRFIESNAKELYVK